MQYKLSRGLYMQISFDEFAVTVNDEVKYTQLLILSKQIAAIHLVCHIFDVIRDAVS